LSPFVVFTSFTSWVSIKCPCFEEMPSARVSTAKVFDKVMLQL
jgi:hypothetical protein